MMFEFCFFTKNLQKITPKEMNFTITSKPLPGKMYPGMMITYRVSPLLNIRTTWVTEITQVEEKKYFVDEQKLGLMQCGITNIFLIN